MRFRKGPFRIDDVRLLRPMRRLTLAGSHLEPTPVPITSNVSTETAKKYILLLQKDDSRACVFAAIQHVVTATSVLCTCGRRPCRSAPAKSGASLISFNKFATLYTTVWFLVPGTAVEVVTDNGFLWWHSVSFVVTSG